MIDSVPRLRGYRLTEPRLPVALGAFPEWFYGSEKACDPTRGQDHLFTSEDRPARAKAASLCRTKCPFRLPCLRWAAEHGEQNFVWGGEDFSQGATRKKYASMRRLQAAAPGLAKPARQRRVLLDEQQLVELWKQGLSDAAIGQQIGMNHSTVHKARGRLGLAANVRPGEHHSRAEVAV